MGRQMHLGVFVLGTGNHVAGWRMPGAFDTFQSLPVAQAIAAIAERGRFDLLFLGDGLAADPRNHPSFTTRLEPITMLSALAATTTHVGLGATASTTYGEPFTVARAFASLDHLERAGGHRHRRVRRRLGHAADARDGARPDAKLGAVRR